jgi:flagellar biosynthesis protein FliQ
MNRRIQAAIIDVLRLDGQVTGPPELTGAEWKIALEYCDSNQLTMPLRRSLDGAPEWVTARLQKSGAANRLRVEKLFTLYNDLCGFESGLDQLALKGFAQWPYFCPDPELRAQYDLDLYCEGESLQKVRNRALALGYEEMGGRERFPTDHLPTMILKTGWEWRGDHFDLEIPFSVELHFRFWDRDTERFGPGDLEGFWTRRETRQWKDFHFTALSEVDSLGYACLHALRHLLRGDARPAHFYEIAWFLNRQQDPAFWEKWNELHGTELRKLEAICFRFARDWFRCPLTPEAQEAVTGLPEAMNSWFALWGRSPLEASFRPNKDELWLHLSLLDSAIDKASVIRRRLIPLKPPGAVDAVHIPDEELTAALRLRKSWRYFAYVAGRVFHHTRVFAPVTVNGIRWWVVKSGLTGGYWRFYLTALIFNLSLMIFYLLYNLHLAGIGYDEGFVGRVTFAMQAGSLIGSLLAAFTAARIGLRPSLILCFIATGVMCALRSLGVGRTELLVFGFTGGVFQSMWAVCLGPTVTMLTNERSRAFAFSLTFATGVGLGMVAGLIGGRLPSLLHSTQNALLLASALAPCAALPLLRLKLSAPVAWKKTAYAVNPFVLRFLGALAIWGAATGAFNPFFNLFFSRGLNLSVEKIGGIYSATQAAQLIAMLASPLVLKRFGVGPAIALMQAATGIALAGLGLSPPALAGWAYGMYMAFQYMSEPGMYNLLMSSVPAEQRTGASAMNFITLFGSQAIASWIAGEAIARYGYRPVLLVAAVLALLAARAMLSVTRSR